MFDNLEKISIKKREEKGEIISSHKLQIKFSIRFDSRFIYHWRSFSYRRVKKQNAILNVCVIFNKRIRVPICLESRNPDSGQSTSASVVPTGDSPTPSGAMNLLLRDRPEIAIYPYNLFLAFRKFLSKRVKG